MRRMCVSEGGKEGDIRWNGFVGGDAEVFSDDGGWRSHGWELAIWLKITVYSRIPPPPSMERSQYMDESSSTRFLDNVGGC
jgi:hypothetical protein